MIQALKNQVIIEYTPPADFTDGGGVIVPSEVKKREILKQNTRRTLDGSQPDIYRSGKLISGECEAPIGSTVHFNRHDADLFEYEERQYYRLPSSLVFAFETMV